MKMEKSFTSLRAYVPEDYHKGKTKFCATCDELATVEALFDVGDGVTLIEKYCGLCTKRAKDNCMPLVYNNTYYSPLLYADIVE